jgi:sialic acid synthase SpsE
MATIQFLNSSKIEDYGKPYIIAEVNTSHFGKIEIAKEMIVKAKESGCDCVKFQSWSEDTLYSRTYYDQNPIAKRFVKKFSFSESELFELYQYCENIGIHFASTPYCKAEVDFLVEKCRVPFIKIASMEINNLQFLEYIGKKNVPIILSTGMSEIDEIKKAVEVIQNTGNKNISILHCVSIYPPKNNTLRLLNIVGLRKEFPCYPVGYSDHSVGTEIPLAAVALGAAIIEKHFTLDKSIIGMDNQMAIEPIEMQEMVINCHNVNEALGGEARIVYDNELEQRKNMRRSIIAVKNLKKGDFVSISDIDFKRPGTGISPDNINQILGKKLKNDIESDTLFKESDFF